MRYLVTKTTLDKLQDTLNDHGGTPTWLGGRDWVVVSADADTETEKALRRIAADARAAIYSPWVSVSNGQWTAEQRAELLPEYIGRAYLALSYIASRVDPADDVDARAYLARGGAAYAATDPEPTLTDDQLTALADGAQLVVTYRAQVADHGESGPYMQVGYAVSRRIFLAPRPLTVALPNADTPPVPLAGHTPDAATPKPLLLPAADLRRGDVVRLRADGSLDVTVQQTSVMLGQEYRLRNGVTCTHVLAQHPSGMGNFVRATHELVEVLSRVG